MRVSLVQLTVQTLAMMVAIGLALFVPAGTLAWAAAWVFFLLMFGFAVALSLWLLRFNPALLAERLNGIGRADQKAWDKVFLVLVAIAFFAWLCSMGLDAVRWRWSQMPAWLQWAGTLLLLGSFWLMYITFRENSYLSPAVRIQSERAHKVVSTGPYARVRHPLYAAFVAYAIGTALLLGSWWGLLGALVLIAMVAWRAVREEKVLQAELEGYAAYMASVRYRFVPGLW